MNIQSSKLKRGDRVRLSKPLPSGSDFWYNKDMLNTDAIYELINIEITHGMKCFNAKIVDNLGNLNLDKDFVFSLIVSDIILLKKSIYPDE